ncbi:MAG: hypothetical protein QW175_04915 [Candidatus Bathyarchaeia archaeon]
MIVLLEKADQPVSIDYVAYPLGVFWVTARALLFELTLQGQIKATKTIKSWVFSLSKKQLSKKEKSEF